MIRSSRSLLLKVPPEVLRVTSGKKVDPACEWPFYFAVEVETMAKLRQFQDDPVFIKFEERVIKPNTSEAVALTPEMEPGKDICIF
ncbi:MAG: hypothetical protein R3F11_00255 [Verrucomicrobiales bacterium]